MTQLGEGQISKRRSKLGLKFGKGTRHRVGTVYISLHLLSLSTDRLVGLVVKASASKAVDPDILACC